MSDKAKYDLIGLDDKCVLTGNNINLLLNSPNLTSIINSLENSKNPSELFFNENNVLISTLSDQLHFIYDNLEKIIIWLDRTLIPSLQIMSNEDSKKCGSFLDLIQIKIKQIKKITKKVVSRRIKEHSYEVICPICNKFFFLRKTSDWLEYEQHEHIAGKLAEGVTFKPVSNEEPKLEPDNCNDVSVEPKIEENESKPEPDNNQEMNINKKVQPVQLCLYSPRVRNVLYPLELTSKICSIEKNHKFYTIQSITASRFHCLLCRIDMYQNASVYSHVSGQKHLKKLNDRTASSLLLSYHLIFSNLPEEMQIHQVVFRPSYKLEFIFCQVCALPVNYENIIQHINSTIHKIRLNTKRFFKHNFFDEMLKSLEIDHDSSEEESSEVSVTTQLVYNSSHNAEKCESEVGSDDEIKSQESVSEDKLEPVQGSSKMAKNPTEEGKTPVGVVKHIIVPAFKENPENLFDQLENRYQIYLDYIKQNTKNPQCILCTKNLAYDLKDIKNHLASIDHKKNAGIQLAKNKYSYYCDLCYKHCRNEAKWGEHLTCIEHRQRIEAILKSKEPRGGPFKEYECTTCSLVIYGNNTTINKHLNENFGIYKKLKKKKEIKLPPQLVNLLRNENLFEEQIYKLSKESDKVLKSIDLSWECCRGIERALEPVFGQCRAYPFGSRVSGLGNLVSDLDVFVDTGIMYEGMLNQDAESQSKLVNQTSRALKRHKDFVDVFAIPNARTPIVQVYHKVTGLDCDLSFRHGLSVENTEFLKLCINIQPKLKTLILFLKRWSYFCKLSDRISTYALSMLCIFYFQQTGLLPSVKKLREIDPTDSKVIAGWQTFCYTKSLRELNILYPQCNVFTRELVIAFFEYYIKFRFNMDVVCPLLGHTVLKSDFYHDKGKRLPPEMKIYVNRINESEENEVFRSMSPMCIQDPFDLSHNLTKACPVDFVSKFVTLCELSLATLLKKI